MLTPEVVTLIGALLPLLVEAAVKADAKAKAENNVLRALLAVALAVAVGVACEITQPGGFSETDLLSTAIDVLTASAASYMFLVKHLNKRLESSRYGGVLPSFGLSRKPVPVEPADGVPNWLAGDVLPDASSNESARRQATPVEHDETVFFDALGVGPEEDMS